MLSNRRIMPATNVTLHKCNLNFLVAALEMQKETSEIDFNTTVVMFNPIYPQHYHFNI